MKQWERLCKKVKGASLAFRFSALYLILIIVPMVIYLSLYLNTVQDKINIEEQQKNYAILEAHIKELQQNVNRVQGLKDLLQNNTALQNMLTGAYESPSREIYDYVGYIRPAIVGYLVSNPDIGYVKIYRNDSALNASTSLMEYVQGLDSFPYGSEVLDRIEWGNTFWMLTDSSGRVYDSEITGGFDDLSMTAVFSIYDRDYTQPIGFVEARIGLEKLLSYLSPMKRSGQVAIMLNGVWYALLFESDDEAIPQVLPAQALSNNDRLCQETLQNPEIGVALLPARDGHGMIYNGVIATIILIVVSAGVFWIAVNRHARRLINFSRHIRNTHINGIEVYPVKPASDEVGMVIHEYNQMVDRVNTLVELARHTQALKDEASFYAMQSQIDKHFMFNTLESIRAYIEVGRSEVASEMLVVFARMLRYNMKRDSERQLYDEVQCFADYIKIFSNRSSDGILCEIDLEPNLENILCPFFILQPIAENCIRHAVVPKGQALKIRLNAHREDNLIVVEVSDNGQSMSPERITELNAGLAGKWTDDKHKSKGIGVDNVNRRLRQFFGEEAGVYFRINTPHGTVCVLRMPLKEAYR